MRDDFYPPLAYQDFHRSMIEPIPNLAWSCRPDGTVEFLNRRWLDYTGIALDEGLGWGWQSAIHPDDLGKLMTTWLDLMAHWRARPGRSRPAALVSDRIWFELGRRRRT
jgi:PAS domain-containing protein